MYFIPATCWSATEDGGTRNCAFGEKVVKGNVLVMKEEGIIVLLKEIPIPPSNGRNGKRLKVPEVAILKQ